MTSLEVSYCTSRLSNTAYSCGPLGELLALILLCERGYEVTPSHRSKAGDLKAVSPTGEIFRVEVKTARRCKDGKWRFTLEKNGKTSIVNTDVVLLLAISKTGHATPFVIPTHQVLGKRQITISSNPRTYKGCYASFRQTTRSIRLEVQP